MSAKDVAYTALLIALVIPRTQVHIDLVTKGKRGRDSPTSSVAHMRNYELLGFLRHFYEEILNH